MIKHYCFPAFLEVPSFVPLSYDVIFRSDFSPCINVCSPTLLLLWGVVLSACLHINALVQDQSMHACEQTIDNYGWDSCVFVASSVVDLYANVHYWRTPNANIKNEHVCGLFMPNYGNR